MTGAIFFRGLCFIDLRCGRHISNVHCAATNQRTAAGASAQLSKGHTNGHSNLSSCCCIVDELHGCQSGKSMG